MGDVIGMDTPEAEKLEPTYTLAETYKKFKDIMLYKLENNIEVAQHVGMYMDVRDEYKQYYGIYPSFSELRKLVNCNVVDTYKRMLNAMETTELSDFDVDVYRDPFIAIVDEVPLDSDMTLFAAYLRMKCVKPYGSDMHGYYRDYYQEREALKAEA